MLAAKSFNTTSKSAELDKWMQILAEELAERLAEDSELNARRPRTLTLYYRQSSHLAYAGRNIFLRAWSWAGVCVWSCHSQGLEITLSCGSQRSGIDRVCPRQSRSARGWHEVCSSASPVPRPGREGSCLQLRRSCGLACKCPEGSGLLRMWLPVQGQPGRPQQGQLSAAPGPGRLHHRPATGRRLRAPAQVLRHLPLHPPCPAGRHLLHHLSIPTYP